MDSFDRICFLYKDQTFLFYCSGLLLCKDFHMLFPKWLFQKGRTFPVMELRFLHSWSQTFWYFWALLYRRLPFCLWFIFHTSISNPIVLNRNTFYQALDLTSFSRCPSLVYLFLLCALNCYIYRTLYFLKGFQSWTRQKVFLRKAFSIEQFLESKYRPYHYMVVYSGFK